MAYLPLPSPGSAGGKIKYFVGLTPGIERVRVTLTGTSGNLYFDKAIQFP